MTFKQLLKMIFDHMSKKGMIDDLEKKYPEDSKKVKKARSDENGAQ